MYDNPIKIRLRLLTKNNSYEVTPDGTKWNPEFVDNIVDEEERFRAKIILPINDEIGLTNWAVVFTQAGLSDVDFFVDIYADTKDDAKTIKDIIENKLPDIKFSQRHKGTIRDKK